MRCPASSIAQVIKQVAMLEFDQEWAEEKANFMLTFNLLAIAGMNVIAVLTTGENR